MKLIAASFIMAEYLDVEEKRALRCVMAGHGEKLV